MINIYTDLPRLENFQLKNLSPLLSFHYQGLDVESARAGEHNPSSPLRTVDDPADAEFIALPMHWSYYLWNARRNMSEALRLAGIARAAGKQVIVWHKGDLVPIMPFENSIVFLPGIIRSKRLKNQRPCPAFVKDPSQIAGDKSIYREKKAKPVVGFCGYASASLPKVGWSTLRGAQLNLSSKLGRYDFEAVPVIPATLLRARALKILSSHPSIETAFVIRDKWTQLNASSRSPSQEEAEHAFFSNIYDTDYTLCLRGYGNWSYRFYETLACGRIPIFIDTECVLPEVPGVDWKKYCVWIDRSEIGDIGEKVSAFHSSISSTEFVELQAACRRLWQDHLTLDGFMADIRAHLDGSFRSVGDRS